jgi:hypothetical protein
MVVLRVKNLNLKLNEIENLKILNYNELQLISIKNNDLIRSDDGNGQYKMLKNSLEL